MRTIIGFFLILIFTFPSTAKDNRQKTLTLSARGVEKLSIQCEEGFLKIVGQPDASEIQVIAELLPQNTTWKEVQKVVKLQLRREGKKVVLISKIYEDGFFSWLFEQPNLRINLTVTVPQTINLDISDGSGFIDLKNIQGNIDLKDGSGDIFLEDIQGPVRIHDGSGSISATSIAGNLKIDDGSGDIILEKIKGKIVIDDGSGDLQIRLADGALNIDDTSGDVELSHITADIDIEDTSGDISITNAEGYIKIDDSSGDLEISNVIGTVEIEDGSGNIFVKQVDGDLIIVNDGGGKLSTHDISGKVIKY
ncbi:DUF4097 family beta strand repeat-containing protein [Calditrichota bacterium LG25]